MPQGTYYSSEGTRRLTPAGTYLSAGGMDHPFTHSFFPPGPVSSPQGKTTLSMLPMRGELALRDTFSDNRETRENTDVQVRPSNFL